jgi:hypothetical protein
MTGGSPAALAGWAGVFIEWMHPASIFLATGLPLVHAGVRRLTGQRPCFRSSYVMHDVASGFALPSFAALALSGWSPALASHVDNHAAALAGAMGIVYTIANIVQRHDSLKG